MPPCFRRCAITATVERSGIPLMNKASKTVAGLVVVFWSLGLARAADDAPPVRKVSDATPKGQPVQIYTLRNDTGCEARITNYGGTVMSLKVPGQERAF